MGATPLDQPALRYPPERPGSGPEIDGEGRECMVMFRDGTWRLCRAQAWQRDASSWRILLRWGVSGKLIENWYVYDPARVTGLANSLRGSSQGDDAN